MNATVLLKLPDDISAQNITLYRGRKNSQVGIIFSYGGSAGFHSYKPEFLHFVKKLQAHCSVITYDYGTWDKDSGEHYMSQGSLHTRAEDLRSVIRLVKDTHPSMRIILGGNSMGGLISFVVSGDDEFTGHIVGLIGCAPAAYPPLADLVNFGPEFTKIIREEGAWKESKAFEIFRRFSGPKLLLKSEGDDVLPKGLIERYNHKTKNILFKRLSGNGHAIFVSKDRIGLMVYFIRSFLKRQRHFVSEDL